MMRQNLIVNSTPAETRIALLEDNRVAEIMLERRDDQGIVGNIYKGIVLRVLPGMNSAFVDIGSNKSTFLFGGDVVDSTKKITIESDEPHHQKQGNIEPISTFLHDGAEILVQVIKEPLGSKGARVTMHLTLPGRYLVLMPNYVYVGISRKIEDSQERARLKGLVEGFLQNEDFGIIIRTAAQGIEAHHLEKDLLFLKNIWKHIQKRSEQAQSPSLVFCELDLVKKTIRDLYSSSMDRIIIDDLEEYKDLSRFLVETIPEAVSKLEYYSDRSPLFDVYEIEFDIARALSSRVELPSGGYLIIEETEALTSIDVNTGRFVGKANARQTILKTNMEAAIKVVEQLRLRNIGGIIILDFIDMAMIEDREMVFLKLQEELKKDRSRTNVLRISELGLVQMTRKRTAESLEKHILTLCPHCEGKGRVKSDASEGLDLLREIVRCSLQSGSKRIMVHVRHDIKEWILTHGKDCFEQLLRDEKIQVDFAPTMVTRELLREMPFEVSPQ